jgi:hypothetical protein
MKFALKPGAEIETTTPQETAELISKALDRRSIVNYTRRKNIITLNASGNSPTNVTQASGGGVEKVSSGYYWRVERLTIGGPGAVNAIVELYENQISDVDLLEVVGLGSAGKYSDAFDNSLYIPANSQILIVVTGGVPNSQVTYNMQIREEPWTNA